MIKLIKGGEIFTPDYQGTKDILVAGGKIAAICDKIDTLGLDNVEIIDAKGRFVVPGIVDGHVHIVGAGGGLGPDSRGTLVHLSTIIKSGVTTAIGILGIDKIGFRIEDLLMRCRALEEEGISTYMFNGSYTHPPVSIIGDIVSDLCLIDKIIGTKTAILETLSSHLNRDELKELISKTYLGGRIGNKAGVVVAHVGDVKGKLSDFVDLMEELGIPAEKFIITHINRTPEILNDAIECGKRGLSVDLTGNIPKHEMIPASHAYKLMLDSGVPVDNITFSSDSGAYFLFNGDEGILNVDVCIKEMKKMVENEGLTLTQALMPLTKVAASRYALKEKGTLEVGKDADILLLDKNYCIDTVLANGKVMLQNYKVLKRGKLEEGLAKNLGF